MPRCKASEIPTNEAYLEVRRSASGPEGLHPGGTMDESNAADGGSPTASRITFYSVMVLSQMFKYYSIESN
jgi:hypothetical protein